MFKEYIDVDPALALVTLRVGLGYRSSSEQMRDETVSIASNINPRSLNMLVLRLKP